MELFNFWSFLIVLMAGYFFLEYKKIDKGVEQYTEKEKIKDKRKHSLTSNIDTPLVPVEDLHTYLGIRKEDTKKFLEKYGEADKLLIIIGQNKYYKVDALVRFINDINE